MEKSIYNTKIVYIFILIDDLIELQPFELYFKILWQHVIFFLLLERVYDEIIYHPEK